MAVNVDRTLRLPDAEYFPEPQAKSGIAIHHTVCDRARTTLALWERDHTPGGGRKRVATAFVIERDGTIYQAFDPACWAWQFGLSWRDDQRIPFEKRFIGIEITSEGGLLEQDGRLYAYEQLDAVGRLVDDLCTRFAIPRVYPEQLYVYYGDALASFQGVIGHAMVRSDKSDPAPDPRLWQTLRDVAGVKPVPVSPSALATAVATPLTPLQVAGSFSITHAGWTGCTWRREAWSRPCSWSWSGGTSTSSWTRRRPVATPSATRWPRGTPARWHDRLKPWGSRP